MSRIYVSRRVLRMIVILSNVLMVCVFTGCSTSNNQSNVADERYRFDVKVMSFNIAGDMDDDDGEWQQRMHEVAKVIASDKPDVIGFQEAYLGNFEIIQADVPGYAYYGLNEMGNADDNDESLRLFYRTDRWAIDDDESGIFWFTSTPEVPGSKDWGALWIRDCVYARLVEKDTNRGLYVYNSHWSYASQESRSKSARLLIERTQGQKHDDPFVIIGDLNAREADESITYLKGRAGNPVPLKAAVYNYVDWVFSASGKFEVVSSEIIDNEEASDHKAISAMIRFKN